MPRESMNWSVCFVWEIISLSSWEDLSMDMLLYLASQTKICAPHLHPGLEFGF